MIAIYARVSTEEQAQKGYSIENQIDETLNKLGIKRDEALLYVDKGYSGEFLERPDLTRLREDVKKGTITQVGCYDPDRLSRKLMNALIIDDEFTKRGVKVVYVNGDYAKTPEGNLFYSLRGAISEFEKAKINERMSGGRKRKAKEGKVVKNSFLYGYDYDKENGNLIINQDEAEVVKMIFDLFTKPNDIVKGINGIAKHLTSLGIPTKRGASQWHRQVVRQILLNTAYKGEYAQNKWNTEGMLKNKYTTNQDEKIPMRKRPKEEWITTKIPPIITVDQFNYAQELLKESRRRWAKQGKRKYLLSGLIRCGKCGNTMSGMRRKHWGKYSLEYFDKKNTAGAKNAGCGNSVKVEKIEEVVWDHVIDIFNNPDKIEQYNERDNTHETFEQKELEHLEREIEKTKKGRKKLMTAYAMSDDMDEQEFHDMISELKKKEDELSEKYSQLSERISGVGDKKPNKEVLKEAMAYYINKKENGFSFEDKQSILRTMVKEIRIFDEDVEIQLF